MTVLFVILQSRVLTFQNKGKESEAQNRTGTEIGTRRNLEVCSTSNGDERRNGWRRERERE